MRAKEESIVISFHSTAEAISFETAAQEQHFPGRLIPIPKDITAGCGMAWMIRTKGLDETWRKQLKQLGCSFECVYRLNV